MTLKNAQLITLICGLWVLLCLPICAQSVLFEDLIDGTDYAQTLSFGDVLVIEEDVIVTIDSIETVPNLSFLATSTPQCGAPLNTAGLHIFSSGTLKFDPSNFNDTLNQVQFGYNFPCGDPFYLGVDDEEPIELSDDDIEIILNNNVHILIFQGFVTISGEFTTFKVGGTDLALDNIIFLFQAQECRLQNLSSNISTCSGATVDVDVDFDYIGTSDSFNLEIFPLNFGKYAYADLPVRANDIPGDGITNYTVIVTDESDDYCELTQLIGTVTCGVDQCTIQNIDLEFGNCGDDFYPITVDFDFANETGIRFRASSSQGELGFFRYVNLPVIVNFPSISFMDEEFIAISDLGDPNCSDTIFFDGRDCSVPPCLINSMDVFVEACVDDSVHFVVDITAQNNGQEFLLFVNGDGLGQYDYNDLPVTIGPYEANDTLSYSIYAEDQLYPYCNITRLLDPIVCDDTTRCNIFDVDVLTSSCSRGLFSAQLNFSTQNVNDTFILFGNQVIYGRYGFNELPITIDGLAGDGTVRYEFNISSVGNECRNGYLLGPITCPSCFLIVDQVEVGECNNDNSVDLTVDLDYMNVGGEFVDISGPLGSFGLFLFENEPITIQYPIIEGDNYLLVSVSDDPSCGDSIVLDLPDCGADVCMIGEIMIQDYICTEDLYDVVIDFTAENVSDSFRVRRGSSIFGEYAYADLPVQFGPFPGINSVVVEVVVEDIVSDICARIVEIGPNNCNPVAVNELLSKQLKIYPSPARESIFIEFPEGVHYSELSIYSNKGEELVTRDVIIDRMDIDVHSLPQGSYILRALSEDGVIRKKFTVIH